MTEIMGDKGRRSRAQLAPTKEVLDYTVRLRKIASTARSYQRGVGL